MSQFAEMSLEAKIAAISSGSYDFATGTIIDPSVGGVAAPADATKTKPPKEKKEKKEKKDKKEKSERGEKGSKASHSRQASDVADAVAGSAEQPGAEASDPKPNATSDKVAVAAPTTAPVAALAPVPVPAPVAAPAVVAAIAVAPDVAPAPAPAPAPASVVTPALAPVSARVEVTPTVAPLVEAELPSAQLATKDALVRGTVFAGSVPAGFENVPTSSAQVEFIPQPAKRETAPAPASLTIHTVPTVPTVTAVPTVPAIPAPTPAVLPAPTPSPDLTVDTVDMTHSLLFGDSPDHSPDQSDHSDAESRVESRKHTGYGLDQVGLDLGARMNIGQALVGTGVGVGADALNETLMSDDSLSGEHDHGYGYGGNGGDFDALAETIRTQLPTPSALRSFPAPTSAPAPAPVRRQKPVLVSHKLSPIHEVYARPPPPNPSTPTPTTPRGRALTPRRSGAVRAKSPAPISASTSPSAIPVRSTTPSRAASAPTHASVQGKNLGHQGINQGRQGQSLGHSLGRSQSPERSRSPGPTHSFGSGPRTILGSPDQLSPDHTCGQGHGPGGQGLGHGVSMGLGMGVVLGQGQGMGGLGHFGYIHGYDKPPVVVKVCPKKECLVCTALARELGTAERRHVLSHGHGHGHGGPSTPSKGKPSPASAHTPVSANTLAAQPAPTDRSSSRSRSWSPSREPLHSPKYATTAYASTAHSGPEEEAHSSFLSQHAHEHRHGTFGSKHSPDSIHAQEWDRSSDPSANFHARRMPHLHAVVDPLARQHRHTADLHGTVGSRLAAAALAARAEGASAVAGVRTGAHAGTGEEERAMRVAVRVRPVSGAERAARQKRALTVVGGRLVAVNPKALGNSGVETVALEAARLGSKHLATTFQFDDVLWGVGDGVGGVDGAEERCIDQTQLHQALGLELVESALSGVSCSCFAYGHTGTGKTYSLFGDLTHAGTRSQGITPQSGLIQRVFHDVIRLSHPSTHVFLSFLEIYNEEIHDLLGESAAPLRPREHSTFGPYVEGLTKVEAGSVEEVLSLVARGQRARATAQTAWNSASSRSHAVVTLELTPSHIDPSLLFVDPLAKMLYLNSPHKDRARGGKISPADPSHHTKPDSPDSPHERGRALAGAAPPLLKLVRLQMVDLAGSEREPEEWGLEVRGEEREKNELKQIRRSLATLGFIIKALASGAVMRSLPYRDSTLTLLLRDALSGRNHTTMLATASPVVGCYEETMATLKYAERLHAVGARRGGMSRGWGVDGVGWGMGVGGGGVEVAGVSRVGVGTLDASRAHALREALSAEFQQIHLGLPPPLAPLVLEDILSKAVSSLPPFTIIPTGVESAHQALSSTPTAITLTTATSPLSLAASAAARQRYSVGYFLDPFPPSPTPSNFSGAKSRPSSLPHTSTNRLLSALTNADMSALSAGYQALTLELVRAGAEVGELALDREKLMQELRGATDMLNEMEDGKVESERVVRGLQQRLSEAALEADELHAMLGEKDELLESMRPPTPTPAAASAPVPSPASSPAPSPVRASSAPSPVRASSPVSAKKLQAQGSPLGAGAGGSGKKGKTAKLPHSPAPRYALAATASPIRSGPMWSGPHTETTVVYLAAEVERLQGELALATAESASLDAMVKQRDALIDVQSQQAERSLRMLRDRQAALDRAGVVTAKGPITPTPTSASTPTIPSTTSTITPTSASTPTIPSTTPTPTTSTVPAPGTEAMAFAQALASPPTPQGEEGQRELELQTKYELQKARSKIAETGSALQEAKAELLSLRGGLLHAVEQLRTASGHRDAALARALQIQAEMGQISETLALTQTSLAHEQAMSALNAQQLLRAKAQSRAEGEQLLSARRDAVIAGEELARAQELMQSEYGALYASVQELEREKASMSMSMSMGGGGELASMTAQRDKALWQRDQALRERDEARGKLAAALAENGQLLLELKEVDQELLVAVEDGEYKLSPQGQHKSLLLSNVSDTTMFGLARRKAHQEAKTPPPLTLPAPTPAPTYPASTAFATPTPAPTTPFSATTLAALANPLQQHNQQQYNNNFQLQQQRYNNIEQQQQVYSTYSAYGAAPASAATLHSQLPQPHQNYPYPSHSLERDSRSRDKIGRAQQEDEEEKEELLERQIQELSGILGEDNRSKRTRRNPHSPPNSHSNLHSHNPLSRSSSLSSIKGASVSTSRSVPPPSHAHASNTPISQRSKVYTPGPSYTPYSP